jgi:hypothetical protein
MFYKVLILSGKAIYIPILLLPPHSPGCCKSK